MVAEVMALGVGLLHAEPGASQGLIEPDTGEDGSCLACFRLFLGGVWGHLLSNSTENRRGLGCAGVDLSVGEQLCGLGAPWADARGLPA